MSDKKKKAGQEYVSFTKEMRRDYTILVPMMLAMHFRLIVNVFRRYGYKTELLENTGPQIAEEGLRVVHNDTCYPAILVIGQFLDALKSGKYDVHKTALLMFQTGGGCRASNYIFLIRKALKKAGYGFVPVISFNFMDLEHHPGFQLTLPILHKLLYAVLYGDLLTCVTNQCRPYEISRGEAVRRAESWTNQLAEDLVQGGSVSYRHIRNTYRKILDDFASIPCELRPPVKVGIVGEIFVKYSPLANNDLEQFLIDEGAEPVVPGLLDFLLYSLFNTEEDYRLYRMGGKTHLLFRLAYRILCKKKRDLIGIIREHGRFDPPTPFEEITDLTEGYIGSGAKMGEGWLLTAEMLELSRAGCSNIVCTQPFGCLPNHICGKGMMRPIREKNPDVNIIAIDYDAGATRVNQENRLKLMLANARKADRPPEAEKPPEDPPRQSEPSARAIRAEKG